MEWRRVCPVSAVREGEGRSFPVDSRPIAIFRAGGVYYAVTDRCPHNGMPLHDGCVEEGMVTCRWHGWRFELGTGRPPGAGPTDAGPAVRVFPVRVNEGWVEIGRES